MSFFKRTFFFKKEIWFVILSPYVIYFSQPYVCGNEFFRLAMLDAGSD